MKLVYGVKDKPSFPKLIVFAIQQLLAIMAATLVVPVIINSNVIGMIANGSLDWTLDKPMSSTVALFGAGIGTLVYLLFTKFRSPVFLGSSFAFLGSMTAAFAGASSMALGYVGLILGAVMILAGKTDVHRVKHFLRSCFDVKYDRKAGREALPEFVKKKVRIPYGVAIAAGMWFNLLYTTFLLLRK